MKSFKQLISEVAQPKSQDEINFKDKHMYDKIDYPVDGTEGQFTSDKKKATRNADYEDDEDQEVYESTQLDENSYSVFKSMPAAPGKSVSNKVQIKAFKTSDQMNKFLSTGDNALQWKDTGKQGLKSGAYKMDMRRGPDGKPARDFIREVSDTKESAFVAKAAAAKKAGKDEFELGNKKFPVTIKKATADKIMEKKTYGPGHIGAIQKMIDKEREAKKAKDAMKKEYTSESIDSINESNDAAILSQIQNLLTKHRDKKMKVVKDKSGFFHVKSEAGRNSSHTGPFHTLNDVLSWMKVNLKESLDEEPQPKWKVQIGNRHYTVTGRSTMEADRKAKILAKKDGNIGVGGKIERLKEEVDIDEAQKLFMFKTKAEADKKAKEVNGNVIPLTKQNFAVVVEETSIHESVLDLGSKTKVSADKDGGITIVSNDIVAGRQAINLDTNQVKQIHSMLMQKASKKIIKDLGSKTKVAYDTDGSMVISSSDMSGRDMVVLDPNQVKKLHNMLMKESIGIDEVKRAPKMKPDFFKQQRDSDIARNLAQGKTPTGREKRTRTQSSTQKSLASIRKESINLVENFKAGSVKLDDGSTVIVKKQDADLLNKMFNDLNTQNKKQMMKVAMTNKNGFEEILGFAREVL